MGEEKQMKNGWTVIFRIFLFGVIAAMVIVVVAVINSFGDKAISEPSGKETITAEQDEAMVTDREMRLMAIMELSELKGRLQEIEEISRMGVLSSTLRDKIEEITNKHFQNPYLADFIFSIPNSPNIGTICEDLILRIDDQIYMLRFGKEKDAQASF